MQALQQRAKNPVFIGGLQKSGTSLVRAILGKHPGLFAGLETAWFDLPWGEGEATKRLPALLKIARLYRRGEDETLALAARAPSAEAFLDSFMAKVCAAEGKPRWIEKTPGNILHAARIFSFWPGAQMIHVLRDPRDVYSSMIEARKMMEASAFVSYWKSVVPAALKLTDARRMSDRVYELCYEAVIADRADAIRKLVAFLNEEWQDDLAEFEGQKDDFDRVLEVTGKASTTLQRLRNPIESGRMGLWRRVIGAAGEAELFREAERQHCLSDMMAAIKRASLAED